jgi:hypothetical protein
MTDKQLLRPDECVMVLVDFQTGLAFGVESNGRQTLLGNAIPWLVPQLYFAFQ